MPWWGWVLVGWGVLSLPLALVVGAIIRRGNDG